MYKNCDLEDSCISLHDCRAEKMKFEDGKLSFLFSNGIWITNRHPKNESGNTVRTGLAQVDISVLDGVIESVFVYIFRKNRRGNVIREEWEAESFINAVNDGSFSVEFITTYQSYRSILFKCEARSEQKPYRLECEMIIDCEQVEYCWNELRYECVW